MKKIQAMLVLMIVLAFGGAMAQTWAVVPPALVPPQGVEKWAVLPQGVELSDEKLAEVEGRLGPLFVAYAVRAAAGAVFGAGSAAVNSWANTGQVNWDAVAKGAAVGAGAGVVFGVIQRYFPMPPKR